MLSCRSAGTYSLRSWGVTCLSKDVSHEPPMPDFRTCLVRNAWCNTLSHLTAAGSSTRADHNCLEAYAASLLFLPDPVLSDPVLSRTALRLAGTDSALSVFCFPVPHPLSPIPNKRNRKISKAYNLKNKTIYKIDKKTQRQKDKKTKRQKNKTKRKHKNESSLTRAVFSPGGRRRPSGSGPPAARLAQPTSLQGVGLFQEWV